MLKISRNTGIIGSIAIVLIITVLLLGPILEQWNIIYLSILMLILGGLVGILLDRLINWLVDRSFNGREDPSIEKPMKPALAKTIMTVPIEPPSKAKVMTEHHDDNNPKKEYQL